MERNRDWTDAMRSALRDAEATPPADGWARLEQELGSIPAARTPLRRIRRVRIAAAAAAVLAGIVAGELFWHDVPDADDLPVVTLVETVADDGDAGEERAAAGTPLFPSPATVATPALADASASPAFASAAAAAPLRTAIAAKRSLTRSSAARSAATPSGSAETASAANVSTASDASSASSASASGKSTVTTTTTTSTSPSSSSSSSSSSARRSARSPRSLIACEKPRRKTSLSLFAAGGVVGSSNGPGLVSRSLSELTGTDEIFLEGLRYEDYRQGSFRHHQPLGFGLTVRKAFGHGLSLETGVAYTLLWSDVRMPLGTEDFSQKLHFIGVPVRVNWNFLQRRRFVLYIGAGGMVETCVAARFGSTSVEEPGAFWSVMGAVGAEYRLGGLVGLYFEPDVSYYFNQTRLRTSRTDSPATFTLRLGVRLNF